MKQTTLHPYLNWKKCKCSEECKRACRAINRDDPSHHGMAWADIGYHPPWLICGFMGEEP